MNKFKVGDKVVRITSGYGEVMKGGVYEVSEVSDKSFLNSYGINLKGHETILGKFTYEASSFELYIEKDLTEMLTPVQAAEAILNKDKLQVFDADVNKWYGFHCDLRNITLEDLKHIKLRHKPKTIVINGVEVPAPLPVGKAPHGVYSVDIDSKPYESYIGEIPEGRYFWATLEDAEKVRDAMLIPFNQL